MTKIRSKTGKTRNEYANLEVVDAIGGGVIFISHFGLLKSLTTAIK